MRRECSDCSGNFTERDAPPASGSSPVAISVHCVPFDVASIANFAMRYPPAAQSDCVNSTESASTIFESWISTVTGNFGLFADSH